MTRALLLVALNLPVTTSLIPSKRLASWRTAATVVTATVATSAGDGTHLSRYCGSGTVFAALGSRTAANNAAQRGELRVNGMQAHGATRVFFGDVLTFRSSPPPPLSLPELRRLEKFFNELTATKPDDGGRLKVLHEDEEMAVVFKPPGVHSTAWAATRKNWGDLTLSDALPLLLTAPSQPASSPLTSAPAPLPSPLPAHRLDARVSGVIAVAKTRRALAGLSQLFKSRQVVKVYRAVVVGEVRLEQLAASGATQ